MPTYEYKCSECEAEFEIFQKMGADPPPCEACQSSNVIRMISGGSFVLKGSGWYKDGYTGASNSREKTESSAKSSETSSSSNGESGTKEKTSSSESSSAGPSGNDS